MIENWGFGKGNKQNQQLFTRILAFCRGIFFLKKILEMHPILWSEMFKGKGFPAELLNFNGEFFIIFVS